MAVGFAEALALIDRVPVATEAKLRELLIEFGLQISAAQKAAVPRDTGHLESGISWETLVEGLKVRSGLLSFGNGRTSRYYGRFVEFGRKAQTVTVIRGTAASRKSNTSRRGRAAGLKLRRSYQLRVPAMAPRPFVNLLDVEQRVARRTANFWNEVLGS